MKVISRSNDIEATELCKLELPDIHACKANFLPGLWAVGLAGSVHGFVEALEMHQAGREAAVVLDVEVQDTGCLETLLVVAPVTTLLDLRLVRACNQKIGKNTLPDTTRKPGNGWAAQGSMCNGHSFQDSLYHHICPTDWIILELRTQHNSRVTKLKHAKQGLVCLEGVLVMKASSSPSFSVMA